MARLLNEDGGVVWLESGDDLLLESEDLEALLAIRMSAVKGGSREAVILNMEAAESGNGEWIDISAFSSFAYHIVCTTDTITIHTSVRNYTDKPAQGDAEVTLDTATAQKIGQVLGGNNIRWLKASKSGTANSAKVYFHGTLRHPQR